MARRKAKKTSHHRRGRRRMGAAGNDTLEMFMGAAVGAIGGYILVTNVKILPSVDQETKSFILGGASYFAPKLLHGNFGMGIGLGMAGAAAISIGKGMHFISGVYAGTNNAGRLSLVNGAQKRISGGPGTTGTGLAVVNGVNAGGGGSMMSKIMTGVYH